MVTSLQQLSFCPLLLPMEAADLVCMAQMGRQQELGRHSSQLTIHTVNKQYSM